MLAAPPNHPGGDRPQFCRQWFWFLDTLALEAEGLSHKAQQTLEDQGALPGGKNASWLQIISCTTRLFKADKQNRKPRSKGTILHLSLNYSNKEKQMVDSLCYSPKLEAAFKERFNRTIKPPLQLTPKQCQLPGKKIKPRFNPSTQSSSSTFKMKRIFVQLKSINTHQEQYRLPFCSCCVKYVVQRMKAVFSSPSVSILQMMSKTSLPSSLEI